MFCVKINTAESSVGVWLASAAAGCLRVTPAGSAPTEKSEENQFLSLTLLSSNPLTLFDCWHFDLIMLIYRLAVIIIKKNNMRENKYNLKFARTHRVKFSFFPNISISLNKPR